MTRDLKVGIVGGVTSSALFLYFIDPIARFILRVTGVVFSGFSNWFFDRICAHAALGDVQDSALFILVMLYGVIIGILFGLATRSIVSKFRNTNDEEASDLKNGWLLRAAFLLSIIFTLGVGSGRNRSTVKSMAKQVGTNGIAYSIR
jgi:hypothetical protein